MIVMALKPGHDGSIAVVRDRELVLSLESEKDSFSRHMAVTPGTVIDIAEQVDDFPDVVALGGWQVAGSGGLRSVGAGYHGIDAPTQRLSTFFGKEAEFFNSSHVRSHIMMGAGMAPREDHPQQAVLVWEGVTGGFYLLDSGVRISRSIPVLTQPGARYAFLFALADPTFPGSGAAPNLDDSGKLMALAAYGDPERADADVADTVERIVKVDTLYPAPKEEFRASPVHNAGVESDVTKTAAALLSRRIFDMFATAAEQHLPSGIPLRISGGCGLNCEWNARWRSEGQFSSVFVPPCTNDSGSAIGTALDALGTITGDPQIEWDVYSGLEFSWDADPPPSSWIRRPRDDRGLARALSEGHVIAWVQGRWEIGPRALGNRSILAEPFHAGTRDRLNAVKRREGYRPVAPCCREEDAATVFHEDFSDPYMLYFRKLRTDSVPAVTHTDGTARAQTVSRERNKPLHELLSAFAAERGVGILCNTSLNFKSNGFINRMSDLIGFCESAGLDDMVVGDTWFQRR